jgi:hypothetical protein
LVESIEGLTSLNAVIYDDAFGVGVDYIVYFNREEMTKCVRVREKESKDYDFKFELQLPEGVDIWRVDGINDYELDTTRAKDFDTEKMTELRTADGTTLFRPFKVWDSEKSEVCVVSYSVEEGKMYLTKHVTQAFMDASVGDVLTDTTTRFNPSNNGSLMMQSDYKSTWNDAHNLTQAASINTIVYELRWMFSTYYFCNRGTLSVDTSALTARAIVTGVTWYGKCTGFDGMTASLVASGQASATAVAVTDFTSLGTTVFCTANWASGGYQPARNVALNAGGISHINKTGYTKMGWRSTGDITDTAPTVAGNYDFERPGSGNTYLNITYTIPPSTSIIFFLP